MSYEVANEVLRDCSYTPPYSLGYQSNSSNTNPYIFGSALENNSNDEYTDAYTTAARDHLYACSDRVLRKYREACRSDSNNPDCMVGIRILFPQVSNWEFTQSPIGMTYCGINNRTNIEKSNPTISFLTRTEEDTNISDNVHQGPINNANLHNRQCYHQATCSADSPCLKSSRYTYNAATRNFVLIGSGNDFTPEQIIIGYAEMKYDPLLGNLFLGNQQNVRFDTLIHY